MAIAETGDIRLSGAVTVRRALPDGWAPKKVGDMFEEYGHLWVVTEASGREPPHPDDVTMWQMYPGEGIERYSAVPVGEAVNETMRIVMDALAESMAYSMDTELLTGSPRYIAAKDAKRVGPEADEHR